MRAVVQRVSRARVIVEDEVVGAIGPGLMVLVGVGKDDEAKDATYLADKIVNLRVFEDEAGKLNRSLLDVGGELLAVSQFTLWGDARKGRRPSFVRAAPGEAAEPLFEVFVARVAELGIKAARGRFGAMMDVELVNQGPVTLILDSRKFF
ncbi:MAG: D-tyrosyl-tRNA(Tyr) deacylase [Proteobacteria bacterium]|nr:D-tyrosyl-tRNA(Tyr) deacylase [Pseudomonadota bacterium]MBU1741161.1 D-tyrosyl-tRNA(Tyr) deacylase [Pseudomonadota bacterium]